MAAPITDDVVVDDRLLRAFSLPRDATATRVSERVVRVRSRSTRDVEAGGVDVDVALKTWEPADGAHAHVEAALLAALAGRTGPALRVQTLLGKVFDDEGAVTLATRWEPGVKRGYADIDDDTWHALGRALAALHTAFDHVTDVSGLPEVPDLVAVVVARDLVAERQQLLDHQRAVRARGGDRFARFFDDRLRLLEAHGAASQKRPPSRESGLLHNDYNEHNYLFVDGRAPMILDVERAARGPRELEVVRCLNHLPLVAPARAARFVAGYRSLRALDPGVVAWCVDVSLVAHAVKHWPVERWLQGKDGADALLDGMAALTTSLAAPSAASALRQFFADALAGAP